MAPQGVRRKTIERVLSQVPAHPNPKPELEQYTTPAPVATDLIFEAFHLGDIGGQFVLDFGCGTGRLAIGAGLVGAMPVYGFDIDEEAVAVAREAAEVAGVSQAEFEALPVEAMAEFEGDTILCNPPFGAQNRHADRPFIQACAQAGRVCYTFHNANTEAWVVSFIEDLEGSVTHRFPFHFELPAQFHFHEKPKAQVDVVVLRWETGR